MRRGVTILAIAAVLIGASLYWLPSRLHSSRAKSAPQATDSNDELAAVEPENTVQSDDAAHTNQPPVAAIRKADFAVADNRPRNQAIATTPAPPKPPTHLPASPLNALPNRSVPGFPDRGQKNLSNDQIASIIKQSKFLASAGQLSEARDLLSETYLGNRLNAEQRGRLAEEAEPIAFELMRSQTNLQDGRIYEVQSGDVLIKIAKPVHVPPEFIMKINGLKNARSIRAGQRLKLVQGPFDAIADLSDFELIVLHHGKFVRRFPIGIGRSDSPTPVGLFKVGTKLDKPTYYPPPSDPDHRQPIPYGNPDNPLGTRWIDIGLGYGIHGTTDPDSIGREASRGCLRMQNRDVEELYDMLVEGSRVLIR